MMITDLRIQQISKWLFICTKNKKNYFYYFFRCLLPGFISCFRDSFHYYLFNCILFPLFEILRVASKGFCVLIRKTSRIQSKANLFTHTTLLFSVSEMKILFIISRLIGSYFFFQLKIFVMKSTKKMKKLAKKSVN